MLRSNWLRPTPSSRNRAPARSRRGAMLVLIAVMIIAYMMTVAFAVDIAYMHLVRSELRTATDSASKAAAQALVKTNNRNAAFEAARAIAAEHTVAGRPLQLQFSELQFGNAAPGRSGAFQFTPGRTPTNSVRVNGRRTRDSLGGAVPLHFGRIFSVNDFQPTHFSTATFVERDVVLVVDRSGSMFGQKFQDLRSAIRTFVSVLKQNSVDEQVGLASYSSDATEDLQFTTDIDQLNVVMQRLAPNGATSISGGIDAGSNIVRRGRSPEFVERTMIVMTDGIHNTGRDPEAAAREAIQTGVVIHTITFGFDADQARMQRIAQLGGGRFFHANDGQDLSDAFREIANTLNTIMTE